VKSINKLKLILIILICVLIILFGFIGAFKKQGNSYKNILKDFKFASDITGSTVLEFEVDKSVNTKYYDADGKEVEKDKIEEGTEDNYTKEEIPANNEESLTEENYKNTVKIMKKRLKMLGADQYRLDLDSKTGKIILVVDDKYIDDIKNLLPLEGKMQLIDSTTEDVILDYTDFDSVESKYVSLESGYTAYINLKLNKSGLEKIKNIDKYKTSQESEKAENNIENTISNTSDNTVSGNTATSTETNSTETEKKFKLVFDTDTIAEMSYDKDLLLNGKTLRLATISNTTSTTSINNQLSANGLISSFANYGKLPVVYTLSADEFVKADILNYNNYLVIAGIVICVIVIIYFIFKYKLNGLVSSLGFVSSLALACMTVRLTGVNVSLNAISAILATILLNFILINNLLKNLLDKEKEFKECIKNAYLKTINVLVIAVIIFLVFAFSNMAVISSVGLLLFWGYFATLLGNLILTVPMLYIINN